MSCLSNSTSIIPAAPILKLDNATSQRGLFLQAALKNTLDRSEVIHSSPGMRSSWYGAPVSGQAAGGKQRMINRVLTTATLDATQTMQKPSGFDQRFPTPVYRYPFLRS